MIHKARLRTLASLGALTLLLLGLVTLWPSPSRGEYTLVVNSHERRGVWEGWGCSLAWWGNGVGGSAHESLYEDLFFTQKSVPFLGQALPGLGLNIVRYNVGGGGRNDHFNGAVENIPPAFSWYKHIDGYWINWNSPLPTSSSWDWTRDSNQRRVLQAARKRGVDHVEFFANAPMWWMTDRKSSAGGALQAWNRRDFAHYLATVVKHAKSDWGVDVSAIEPFNEPSAGWWKYPLGQEGCNFSLDQQAAVIGDLRQELDAQGLRSTPITASDENAMTQATAAAKYFLSHSVSVNGRSRTVADLTSRVNVHSYSGLEPWRDNAARQSLRRTVKGKPLWMSEYGDGDGSGMVLAQTITEDLTYLQPTAWIYWQPVEPYSAWGLVNGHYADSPSQPDRGAPAWVYTKYYVMAQFTRFLRPGNILLGSNDHNSVVAYDPRHHLLSLITVNYGNAQPIHFDLSGVPQLGNAASVTQTCTDGTILFRESKVGLRHKTFTVNARKNSIYSVVIGGVHL